MKKRIMSIDISKNHFGYCIFDDNELVFYKIESLPTKGSYGFGQEKKIYAYFKQLLNEYKPDILLSEKFYCGINKSVYGTLQAIQGIIMAICFENNTEFIEKHIGSYRSYLKIKKDKSEKSIKDSVIRVIQTYYPNINFLDKESDLADAFALNLSYRIENNIFVD